MPDRTSPKTSVHWMLAEASEGVTIDAGNWQDSGSHWVRLICDLNYITLSGEPADVAGILLAAVEQLATVLDDDLGDLTMISTLLGAAMDTVAARIRDEAR